MNETHESERAGDAVLLEVGLTGGIASGKSTVDSMLENLGARIIDADAIVHRLLAPDQPEYDEVVEHFGRSILHRDGSIDRGALAAIVFADAGARADLNALIHPGVRREEARMRAELQRSGASIVITDAALLVETGHHGEYDRLLVVACDRSLQLSRLLARHPGMRAEEATARMAAQGRLEDKLAVADYVIDTSGSLADTERRTHEVYVQLHEDLEAKRERRPLPTRPPVSRDLFGDA